MAFSEYMNFNRRKEFAQLFTKISKNVVIRIQIQNRFDLIVLNTKNKLDEGHLEIRQFT